MLLHTTLEQFTSWIQYNTIFFYYHNYFIIIIYYYWVAHGPGRAESLKGYIQQFA